MVSGGSPGIGSIDGVDAFAGIIPSAGASARMGQPKALLQIEGETFLRRAVSALADGGCDPVLVVVAPGQPRLTREAEDAGAEVLVNPDPGEGPITSLRLALSALRHDSPGFAYLPVDHPMVHAETVWTLLQAARTSGAPLTIPVHRGKRGHPSIFSRELFDELEDPTLQGGARVIVHRHLDRAFLVDVADPGVLVDIDTPEAYAEVTQ